MAVSISYDQDDRLRISGIECGCPCEHHLPTQDIYVGTGLIGHVPAYLARRSLGTHCVLVADKNTYEVAGRLVEKALCEAGISVILCVIRREHDVDPDENACGEVLLSIQPETEFLFGVGSGSITDITRVNATRTGLPFVSIGTAPSMDGYTSVVAPLLLRGVKIHRAGVCPEIIVCDIDVLRTAPLGMVQSGVGDVLGKYIAKADWKIGSIINDEPYCDVCGEIVTDAVKRLLDNVDEIRSRSEKGIRILIEGLLLAGVTIMIVGHTRAVASVEHNIAHYWEMMQLLHGEKAPAHGASVGVATLLAWPLFTRFVFPGKEVAGIVAHDRVGCLRPVRVKHPALAFLAADAARPDRFQIQPGEVLPQQERRVRRAQERFGDLRAAIEEMPSYERILDAMRKLGAPVTAAELGVDERLLESVDALRQGLPHEIHAVQDHR